MEDHSKLIFVFIFSLNILKIMPGYSSEGKVILDIGFYFLIFVKSNVKLLSLWKWQTNVKEHQEDLFYTRLYNI